MRLLSLLAGLFKACVPVEHEEIALHVSRLNGLLSAYPQIKTLPVAEWQVIEREIEMELQWFGIHGQKFTRGDGHLPES